MVKRSDVNKIKTFIFCIFAVFIQSVFVLENSFADCVSEFDLFSLNMAYVTSDPDLVAQNGLLIPFVNCEVAYKDNLTICSWLATTANQTYCRDAYYMYHGIVGYMDWDYPMASTTTLKDAIEAEALLNCQTIMLDNPAKCPIIIDYLKNFNTNYVQYTTCECADPACLNDEPSCIDPLGCNSTWGCVDYKPGKVYCDSQSGIYVDYCYALSDGNPTACDVAGMTSDCRPFAAYSHAMQTGNPADCGSADLTTAMQWSCIGHMAPSEDFCMNSADYTAYVAYYCGVVGIPTPYVC